MQPRRLDSSSLVLMATAILLACLGTSVGLAETLTFSANELIEASTSSTRNERPRLVFTDDGRAHVVWAQGDWGAEGTFLVSAETDGTYGTARMLSNGLDGVLTGEGYGPTIEAKGQQLAVGYEDRETTNRGAWLTRSSNMGADWDSPVRADPQTNEDRAYQCIASFSDGRLSTPWMKYDGGFQNPRYEWTAETAGGGFTAPIVATQTAGTVCECCSPFQVILDDDSVLLAFRRNALNIREIHFVRSTDGGATFPHLDRVDTTNWFLQGCPGSGPHIAHDGSTVIVTWLSAATGIQHIYAARSTDRGVSWEPMIQLDAATEPIYQGYPQVAVRDDIAVVVWEGTNASGQPEILSVLSTDGGATWGEQVIVTDDGGTALQREATVAIAPDYRVEVVWKDRRDGVSNLYRAWADPAPASAPGGNSSDVRLDVGPVRPNPSSGNASLALSIKDGSAVHASVHDARGRLVSQLEGGWLSAGDHVITWDGSTDEGIRAGAGTYWIRVQTPRGQQTRSVSIVR